MTLRSLSRVLAIAGAMTILALATMATAAAAPAQPSRYRECFSDGDTGNTICYTIHDVEQETQSAAGIARTHETGSMLIEYFDAEGNLLWSDKTQWNTNILDKGGEWQVYHDQVRVKYTDGGETCTNGTNVTSANGEVRHPGPEWEWVCK